MAYQIVPLPMSLSELQCHSPIGSLFKRDFLYSFAVLDKISPDTERRAVPLHRQSSLLFSQSSHRATVTQ